MSDSNQIQPAGASAPEPRQESPEHQEYRARLAMNWAAAMKAAICAGTVFFFLPGGSPWNSAGTMNAVMGRALPWGLFPLLAAHFALALIYSVIIGSVIYRLTPLVGIATGTLLGIPLYFINRLVFTGFAASNSEGRAVFVHILFALLASILYKVLSVPKPYPKERTIAH